MQALSVAVRDHRHGRLREVMRAERLDALLLTGADFFSFASNHDMTDLAWERPFLLVLPASGNSLAILADQGRHLFEMERARGTLWVDELVFYSETPHLRSGVRPATEWRELVAETLTARGLDRSRLGCDAATGPLNGALSLLPGIELANVNAALRPTRWVKHPEEVAVMSALAGLSAAVMPQYRGELQPGRSVQQADAAIAARLHAEAEQRFPGANFSIVKATTVAGAASASPHGDGVSCGRRVEADSVAVEANPDSEPVLIVEIAQTSASDVPLTTAIAPETNEPARVGEIEPAPAHEPPAPEMRNAPKVRARPAEPTDRTALIRQRWAETGIRMWNPRLHGTGEAALNIQGSIGLLPPAAGETMPRYDKLEFKMLGGQIVCEGVIVEAPAQPGNRSFTRLVEPRNTERVREPTRERQAVLA